MSTCKGCNADLTEKHSVTREYINKDDAPSKFITGHYEKEEFEPDGSVDLQDGRYDLVDGSDTCSNCNAVLA